MGNFLRFIRRTEIRLNGFCGLLSWVILCGSAILLMPQPLAYSQAVTINDEPAKNAQESIEDIDRRIRELSRREAELRGETPAENEEENSLPAQPEPTPPAKPVAESVPPAPLAKEAQGNASLRIIQGKEGEVYELAPPPSNAVDKTERNTIIIPGGDITPAAPDISKPVAPEKQEDTESAEKTSAAENSPLPTPTIVTTEEVTQEVTEEEPLSEEERKRQILIVIGGGCIGFALLLVIVGVWFALRPTKNKKSNVVPDSHSDGEEEASDDLPNKVEENSSQYNTEENETDGSEDLSLPAAPASEAGFSSFTEDSLNTGLGMMEEEEIQPLPLKETDLPSASLPPLEPMDSVQDLPLMPEPLPEEDLPPALITESEIKSQVDSTISEADKLIRNGQVSEARELIENHLEKCPANRDLMVKLLEVLMLSRDRIAFNALASKLNDQMTANKQQWETVTQWGRLMDPANAMYEDKKPVPLEPETIKISDRVLEVKSAPAPVEPFIPPAMDEPPATPPRPAPLSNDNPFAGHPLQEGDDPEMTFEKGLKAMQEEWRTNIASQGTPLQPEPVSEDVIQETSFSMTPPVFSSSQAEDQEKITPTFPPVPDKAPDLTQISLDLNVEPNSTSNASLSSADLSEAPMNDKQRLNYRETESRLELVRAYVDMGDKIGAKELLDEILKTAQNSRQREIAEELLRDLR